MIKAIAFDLGGVVLASEQEQFYRHAQAAFGLPLTKIKEVMWRHQPDLERGDLTISQFWQAVMSDLGQPYDAAKDDHLWSDHYVEDSIINEGILRLIDQIRDQGIKVVLLSNTHAEHVDLNRHRHIFEHFDVCFFSNEMRARKPEAKAYKYVLNKLGIEPVELVFFDDRPENVDGAKDLGIQAFKYHDSDHVISELKELGLNL